MDFTFQQYVADVLNGEQVAGEMARHACRRHAADLETGHQRGLHFDEQAARMAIAFFMVLNHWKGEWAGQPVMLEPWQQFVVANLFGWKREDGTRRFRTCYLEVARKNGKTTMAAGIGLYLMLADGEPGAEVYTAATKRDQARIAHRDATEMVQRSPHLKKICGTFKDNIYHEDTASKFEPLGRDSNSLDGLNVHAAICDEVHAWKTRDMWDVLETATGSRRQALMLAITTAGYDRQSFCYEQHEYTEKVLAGVVDDDTHFGVIYAMDEEDDWEDERNWIKANPNLHVSKKIDDMRRLADRAREMPAALNSFLRLHLNVWTQAETRWINRNAWDACGEYEVDAAALQGRRCYGGLDLSSTTDISAWVLVFPPVEPEAPYEVLCRFWIPGDNAQERIHRDRVPYDAWIRHGYLEATPGNVIDYDWILHQIDKDMEAFRVEELAFDRWGSQKIVTDLQDLGFTVDQKEAKLTRRPLLVQFGQGFASMAGPMRELEKLILGGKLAHGNHPVLTWMADNLVAREDPAGNLKPDKAKSIEKIDGMVALVMGLARAVAHGQAQESVYSSRGIQSI